MAARSIPVAIMGQEGSYHDAAATHYFGEAYDPQYLATFSDVFDAVASGTADRGVTALENSIAGPILEVHTLLQKMGSVSITGEVFMGIHHSLVGRPGTQAHDINNIYSHPMALKQCGIFLGGTVPNAETHVVADTATGVMMVRDMDSRTVAAIGSAQTALRHGLEVLAPNIEDDPTNTTRFLVLSRTKARPAEDILCANKTSILLEGLQDGDEPLGKLPTALDCFRMARVPVTTVRSQPDNSVFLDVKGGALEEPMRSALQVLNASGLQWRELGTYQEGQRF